MSSGCSLVMIQAVGIGLLIGALLSRARPQPSPQFPPAQFPPAQFPPAQFPPAQFSPTGDVTPWVLGCPPPQDKGYPGLGTGSSSAIAGSGRAALIALGTSSAEFRHTWSMVMAGASGDGVGVNGPGAVRMRRRVIRRQTMP
jgi:hypothetical protein